VRLPLYVSTDLERERGAYENRMSAVVPQWTKNALSLLVGSSISRYAFLFHSPLMPLAVSHVSSSAPRPRR
jgi:hypothetical protein